MNTGPVICSFGRTRRAALRTLSLRRWPAATLAFRWVLSAIVLSLLAPLPVRAAGNAINFSTIPNLEEMKNRPVARDFTLANRDGKKSSLKDFRGKVVFLNFWATWCESCREELPAMERLYQEYKGRGFEVVSVNVQDKRADALAFAKKLKLSYPILLDSDGDVTSLYGAFGLPASYLIDRKGVLVARLWGPADWYSPAARKLIAALTDQN